MLRRNLIYKATLLCLSGVILLTTACSGLQPQAAPTEEPGPAEPVTPVVSATGLVVPAGWASLSLKTQGVIEELLVSEDSRVEAGDVLLRLQGEENLQAAIAAAQLELFSAEQALDALYDDLDLQLAQVLQEVAYAEDDLKDKRYRLDSLNEPSKEVDIDQARATVLLAKIALDKAWDKYEPYENKSEDNLVRATYFQRYVEAKKQYDDAVNRLNNLLGTVSDVTMSMAEADLALAEAQLAEARRRAEILQDGPDPDDVRAAEERVANARAQLDAAEAARDDLELRAPFAGVVTEVYVRPAEWVAPGTPVLLLADLGKLRVETTDLNEIDVARLEVGDTASVTFDAMPEVVTSGKITRIASKASTGTGVNYKVVLELDEIPAGLRWGMTAFVDVEVD